MKLLDLYENMSSVRISIVWHGSNPTQLIMMFAVNIFQQHIEAYHSIWNHSL